MNRLLLAFAIALAAMSPVSATSTSWTSVEGGSVRLVTEGEVRADGTLRAALDIRLEPGWKTYWLDPGSAGVPPTFTVTTGNVPVDISIGFPPPKRFNDESGEWAGYDQSVALPITLHVPSGALDAATVQAFLGICETICIPVQASWTLDLTNPVSGRTDRAVVEAAFAARPAAARADFGATVSAIGDDAIVLDVAMPDGVEIVDLFVAGTESVSLAAPVRDPGAATSFHVPILGLYGKDPWHAPLRYTLVTSAGAVSGSLDTK
jgi:DsbC/DsbD-like thiol-disulfide interchange protein